MAYDNIKPFRDFIDGLVEKLKAVGSAIADFFGGIGDFFGGGDKEVNVKANVKVDAKVEKKVGDDILKLFKEEEGKLKTQKDKTDKEKDEAAKAEDAKVFNSEKERILKLIAEKKKLGALDAEQEKELIKKISAIKLEAGKGKELKSLTEEIKKAKLENDKIISDLTIKAIEDEKERDLKASDEKTKNAIQAVENEIDKVKKMENVVNSQRITLIKELQTKIGLVTQQGEAELSAIKGKYRLKANEESIKLQQELSKKEIDELKANYEALKAIEGENQTGGGILVDIAETNAAKLRLIDIQNEAEIAAAIDKNRKVIEAREELKKALLSNDQTKIDTANSGLVAAVADAEKTDIAVLAVKIKGQKTLEDAQKESFARLESARIAMIKDSAEREKAERDLQTQIQLDSALEKAKGNERLIVEAHAAANLAKYNSDEMYARKSKDLAVRGIQAIKDLGMSIAGNLSQMYGNTFNDLNKAFDDFAGKIQKKIEDSNNKDTKKTDEAAALLLKSLQKKEISYQEYQSKLAELQKDSAKDSVTASERAALAIGKSFQEMAKVSDASMKKSLAKMNEHAKDGTQTAESFKEDSNAILTDMGSSIVGVLGQMAAAGTLTLESAGKAALGIALDTAGSVALAQSPAIMAVSIGQLGPIVGAIAGIAAIAGIQLLIATTKAAVTGGFFEGGYTGDGNAHDVAGAVHKREVVFESGITQGNKFELLELRSMMQSGTKLSEILSAYNISSSEGLHVNQLGNLATPKNQVYLQPGMMVSNGQSQMENNNVYNELTEIRKLLKNQQKGGKSKSVTAMQLDIKLEKGLLAKESKKALRLEKARG